MDNEKTTSGAKPARGKNLGSRKRPVKGTAKKAVDLGLVDDMRELAGKVSDRLLTHLPGSVLLQFEEIEESIFVQGKEKGLEVEVRKDEAVESDCTIVISEEDFARVIEGSLNPQVAMLSDKIHVEGKMSLAVYFFNVFAPSEGGR